MLPRLTLGSARPRKPDSPAGPESACVSTIGQNVDTQLDALHKAGCDEIFQDEITGISTSRPVPDTMLAQLRSGDTVMVARFFRLGHSWNHLNSLLGEFSRKSIHFKALELGVDSSTPASKLILQIFAALTGYNGSAFWRKPGRGSCWQS